MTTKKFTPLAAASLGLSSKVWGKVSNLQNPLGNPLAGLNRPEVKKPTKQQPTPWKKFLAGIESDLERLR